MRKRKRHSKAGLYLKSDFPLMYDYLCALRFPMQLLAVGLVGVIAVKIYTSYFSYSASQKNFNKELSEQSIASRVADNPDLDDELQKDTLKAGSSIVARNPKRQEIQIESVSSNPPASVLEAADTFHHHDSNLYNGDWMQQQPENHYVVQLAAGTEQQKLIQYAQEKVFNPPIAIYPFKVNKNGEMVYGLSVGLFAAINDARTELPALSDKNDQNGVWVRKVADIKNEMAALNRSRTLP